MGKDIWIVSAKRTPIGRFQGKLQTYSAPQLGALAIKAAMHEVNVTSVDEVFMGCVLQQGVDKLLRGKHLWGQIFLWV